MIPLDKILQKKKFNPPERECYIEDEGDEFQVLLFENGVQVGGCMLPDDGSGAAFELADQLRTDWLTFYDRTK